MYRLLVYLSALLIIFTGSVYAKSVSVKVKTLEEVNDKQLEWYKSHKKGDTILIIITGKDTFWGGAKWRLYKCIKGAIKQEEGTFENGKMFNFGDNGYATYECEWHG